MSTIATDKQKMRDYALKLRRYFAGNGPPEARWAADLKLAERWVELIDSPRVDEAAINSLLAGLHDNRRDHGCASYELTLMIELWASKFRTGILR
jgi:hypothetical protein